MRDPDGANTVISTRRRPRRFNPRPAGRSFDARGGREQHADSGRCGRVCASEAGGDYESNGCSAKRVVAFMWSDQSSYDLRCEWGEAGVAALAPSVDAIVIVDVLSFSSCVDVAVARGARIYHYQWKDESEAEFAR